MYAVSNLTLAPIIYLNFNVYLSRISYEQMCLTYKDMQPFMKTLHCKDPFLFAIVFFIRKSLWVELFFL